MKMTFDDKLKGCFENFYNITKPDYTSIQTNFYADFVELICLFSNSDGVTTGDINDRFFGIKDYSNNTETASEQRDKDERFIDDIFQIIEERINLFGNDYPFFFNDFDILELRKQCSWKNKLYLGMLVSSKLNIFKNFQSDLTTEFETISYNVLKNTLPNHAIIKEFGKNSCYKGNTIKKITELAKDIGVSINEHNLSCVDENNNQERGLDVIGWIPFKDNCKNKLIYLAQCACGKDTESKYHDTRRFENYFNFYKTKPQHIMFIPYSLINVREEKFYHSDLIEKDFLIFERKRIIDLFDDEVNFKSLKMKKIVNECIKFKQDIV